MDELAACVEYNSSYRNACAVVLTETWLESTIPDSCLEIPNFTLLRADRTAEESGKSRGGGLCVYVNSRWCNNFTIKHTSCSVDLEVFLVQCRPYYLPREICCVAFLAVYIPPSGNKNKAIDEITTLVMDYESNKPDSAVIILGDFNGATLQDSLPKYTQYVHFPTCGQNTLDLCYSNIPSAFKAHCLPPLGCSDHNMLLLLPAYVQKAKTCKPVTKSVRQWDEESTSKITGVTGMH